ncbi:MAG: hypothetical protein K2X66_08350 [Cyanobacteria bacterium]|nr:hypothetical protein [Cyanobacteriota bacterium]
MNFAPTSLATRPQLAPKFSASSSGGFRLEHHDLYVAAQEYSYAKCALTNAQDRFQKAEMTFNETLGKKNLYNHDVRVGVGKVLEHLCHMMDTAEVRGKIQGKIDEACN